MVKCIILYSICIPVLSHASHITITLQDILIVKLELSSSVSNSSVILFKPTISFVSKKSSRSLRNIEKRKGYRFPPCQYFLYIYTISNLKVKKEEIILCIYWFWKNLWQSMERWSFSQINTYNHLILHSVLQ
jgi:hypothetical protein